MDLPLKVRQFLVKDFKLPFPVLEDPYWEHYVDLFDELYETKRIVKLAEDALKHFGGEKEFLDYNHACINQVLDHVKSHPKWESMSEKDSLSSIPIPQQRQKLYVPKNGDKDFVSLDLVKANFQVFKIFYPEFVDGKDSYEEFISQFTTIPYFMESKQIRQVIFGHLNPKKQQQLQKRIIGALVMYLKTTKLAVDTDLLCVSSDEVVFPLNVSSQHVEKMIGKVTDKGLPDLKLDLRSEFFKLVYVGNERFRFFIKKFHGSTSIQVKGVSANYMPEVVCFLNGEKSDVMDRTFTHEGRLAVYKEGLL